jgi:hypothetical protein
MDDSALDSAIDDVAREMTAGAPHASFRAQVVARIENETVRRSPFDLLRSQFVVLGSAFAGAALLAIAVIEFRGSPQQPAAQVAVAPAAGPRERGPAEAGRHVAELPPAEAGRRIAHRSPAPASVNSRFSAIDDLAPPALDVNSITVAALSRPASIEVDDLQTIAPIAIAPLSAGDQGERR